MMSPSRVTIAKQIAENNVLTGIANLRLFNRFRLLPHNGETLTDRAAAEAERFDMARRLGCGRPGRVNAQARAQRRLPVAVK
ncbi:MAG: hypothetical protein ABJA98_04580 [Acidobacteriota bacterium]